MIQIITGEKGEGKTKHLINMANECVKNTSGHIIYLDNDHDHIYDLNYKIRFIETNEFPVNGFKEFFGFICGILAQDHDIEYVYIDGLLKITKLSLEDAHLFLEKLKKISKKYTVNFIIGLNCKNNEIPDNFKSFLIA
ncbi:hypothetical protein [Defluviitalea phaphyphila]|uniref:hypothetical protein n=1 Tax=Defluviitalea phaphyphila TaxID=1473580 RepID=UPI0007315921|nr:hypothetical protein [Defluviitalea phaphyphila]